MFNVIYTYLYINYILRAVKTIPLHSMKSKQAKRLDMIGLDHIYGSSQIPFFQNLSYVF